MLRSFAVTAAFLLAAPATAQSVELDGVLGAGISDMARGELMGYVDATLSFPLTSRAPLSFEAGTYLFALDGKKPHETYAALVWDGRYRIGVLRPAYDSVLPSVFERHAPFLAYARAEYSRSHNTVEAMRRTAVPWGLSAEGRADRLEWRVSVHDAVKGSFRSASAAVVWHGEGWQALAAVESVWSRAALHHGTNAKIGLRANLGKAEFGLSYLHPDANKRPDAIALDLSVPITARFGLHLMGEFTENAQDDAYGIALDVNFDDLGTATFAATDGAAGPGLHLTYSYRF